MIRPLAFAALATAFAAPAAAADPTTGAPASGWQFEVTPYVWLPTIGGTFRGDTAGGGSTDFEIKPGSYLKGFQSGIALTGEVRKGRIQLSRAWFLPYYADFGTGDSNFTYQLAGGIGYQTGWLGVSAGWRALVMNQAADEPVDTLTLSGPYLAFNMNF